jgi:hypothetical protein
LLANGSANTFSWQRINTGKHNNRGTVRHDDIFGSPRSYKRVNSFERVSRCLAFIIRKRTQELSVQLWSVNQRTTEAE